jgi:ankyrin repeat protein
MTIQDDEIKKMQAILAGAYKGDVAFFEEWLDKGADIDVVEETTGLSPLHIAVGRNHLDLVKLLLKFGASITPDRQGRWPSTIAELCEVDEEICDLIVGAEARAQRGV